MGTSIWEIAQPPLSIHRMCELLEVNRSYYYRQHCQSSGSGGAQFDEEITKIDRAIDRLVYDLYGLTEDEIKVVEKSVWGDKFNEVYLRLASK